MTSEGLFECASAGMERVVLGAHDGLMSWTLRVGAERSEEEQRLVSRHERLHHDLHQSAPWGLAMAAVAARPGALDGLVWRWLSEGCRLVHELFATYFSVASDPRFDRYLEDNDEYRAFRDRAAALGAGETIPDRWRNLVVDALLRAAMAPAALMALDLPALQGLRLADLDDELLPERRLKRIERFLADSGDAAFAAPLRVVEDEDLHGLPRFRDAVAELLNAAGIPTMSVADHRAWGTALTAALNGLGVGTFELVDRPEDPVDGAFDDYQRERLRLHDAPLPLRLVTPQDPGWEMTWLARGHDVLGPHGWLVWMRVDLLAAQFDVQRTGLDGREPALGFLAVDRVHGDPVARMWHFSELSPAIVAARLSKQARMPVVFFTTLATILDSGDDDDFRGIDPTFVLLDQPLDGFLERMRERGAQLRWRITWLRGDREVAVFVLAHDQLDGVYFLLVTSHSGYDAVLAWLLRRPADEAVHDAALVDEHAGYLDALLHHLVGSFHELHLFAGAA